MKKYILLISLFCFTALQVMSEIPQDSVKIGRKKLSLPDMNGAFEGFEGLGDLKDLDFNFEFDSSQWAEFRESFKLDSNQILAMKENIRENLKNMPSMKNFSIRVYSKNQSKGQNQKTTNPRIEKKTFTNISEIEFFHKYGNIVIQESNSKQVELEIQYFDKGNNKGSATITTKGNLLSVFTDKSSKSAKINYIISIPKNTALNIDLKYGTVKIDKHEGILVADLSYSNLSAQSITKSKPVFSLKYSEVKIDEAEDISFSASYSDVKLKKARHIQAKGMYTDYNIENAVSFSAIGSSAYGDIYLGTVSSINLDTKYSDIIIGNLVSDITAKTAYGDITIKSVSPKVKNIDITANYADISVGVPDGTTIAFDTDLTYGDLSISKKHNVKYTENRETNTKSIKIGQIGSGTPNAKIKIRNMYADVQIR